MITSCPVCGKEYGLLDRLSQPMVCVTCYKEKGLHQSFPTRSSCYMTNEKKSFKLKIPNKWLRGLFSIAAAMATSVSCFLFGLFLSLVWINEGGEGGIVDESAYFFCLYHERPVNGFFSFL